MSSTNSEWVRPRSNVEALAGYHSPQVEVDVRLNTNESPIPPPDEWFESMARAVEVLRPNRYPDRNATQLRTRIAQLHNVELDNVWCANGSNEIIQSLVLAYGGHGRSAVVFEPTYAMHSHIARVAGTTVEAGTRNENFEIDRSELAKLAPQADLLFLCSPNNPTGTVETDSNIRTAIAATKGVTLVDEAYGQFSDWTAIDLVDDQAALCVSRTFSKTWAMAGLRLGYLIAPAWLIADLQAVALPYHLSSLTQAAGIAALDFEDEMNARIELLVAERARLVAALGELDVESWPSGGNFVLFRSQSIDGTTLWGRLLEKSVLVRDTSSWEGLSGCLRVTVGLPHENDRFIEALKESLQ